MNLSAKTMVKLVSAAVAILCFCEIGAILMRPFVSSLAVLAIVRSVEILFLLILIAFMPGLTRGLDLAGLGRNTLGQGLKTGLIWSFVFGLTALAAGILLYMAGINPLALIRTDLPRENLSLFFLTAGVIGPIAEEIFFRGILYSALRQKGVVFALFTATLVFALFHLSLGSPALPMVPIVGGLVFALAFEHSKSLVAPIIIHILGNLALFSLTWSA
jgi:hypothetical protein